MPSILVNSLNELARKPVQSETEKKEIYNAALRLAWSVESEQDTAQRLYHGHLPLATAQTGIDLGLFVNRWTKGFNFLSDHADAAFTVEELAVITHCDPALLFRLLGFFSAHQMVLQTPEGSFTASNITQNLAIPGTEKGIKHYSLTMTPCYNSIPEYLESTNYVNPTDKAPFNLAYNTDMRVFDWRNHNPKNAAAGQAFMAAQRMGQRSVWDGRVSLKEFEMSTEDLARGRVMMCDVGGGRAHQCTDLRKYRPDLEGRIVSEDLELVQGMIENHDELKKLGVELQRQDFMQEQAVEGAKVYYLRNVIHNWNDEGSTTILSQISKVMAEDSSLILDDIVMPTLGLGWKQASMDLAMMTMLAAKERSENDFERLLNAAGLTIKEIRTYDEDYGDSLIIAKLLPARIDEKFDDQMVGQGQAPTVSMDTPVEHDASSEEAASSHESTSNGYDSPDTAVSDVEDTKSHIALGTEEKVEASIEQPAVSGHDHADVPVDLSTDSNLCVAVAAGAKDETSGKQFAINEYDHQDSALDVSDDFNHYAAGATATAEKHEGSIEEAKSNGYDYRDAVIDDLIDSKLHTET